MKSLVYTLLFFTAINFKLHAQTMSQMFGNTVAFAPVAGRPGENVTAQLTGGNYFQKQNIENNNNIGLPGYTSNDAVDENAYFSKEWVKGSVTATDHNTYGSDLVFMYDKISGNLYFRKPDSAIVMQADMDKIVLFYLFTDKPHVFVKSDYFPGADKNHFYEVLVLNDNKYSLFKFTRRVYETSSDNKARQALTEDMTSGSYQDKTSYFLYSNSSLKEVELRKNNFLNAMDADKDKVEQYIHTHKGNFNEEYVAKMLVDLN